MKSLTTVFYTYVSKRYSMSSHQRSYQSSKMQ